MDPRIERAQELYWRVYGADECPRPGCSSELSEMAELHEGMARDCLDRGDARGWIDWYAALTALGDAGRIEDARTLIAEGRRRADAFAALKAEIDRELSEFENWLWTRPGGRGPVPPPPRHAIPTKV